MRLIFAMVLAGACGVLTSCIALPSDDGPPEDTPITAASDGADDVAAVEGGEAVRRVDPLVRLGPQDPIPVVSPTGADPGSATTQPAEGAPADGDRIGRRTGYLRDSGDDGWVFQFRDVPDKPDLGSMTVLPGSILESMEQIVADNDGPAVLFGISGELTRYRQRSYLIIRRAVVQTPSPEADHRR